MGFLISAREMLDHMGDFIIYDCRYRLTEPEWGREQYEKGHIPGAFFFDLNKDMASDVGAHGGRHPLPDIDEFVSKLESTGLKDGGKVICYDDNLSGAARMWFLLKYIGFDSALILNGGIQGWIQMGGRLESGNRERNLNGKLHINLRENLVVDHEFIHENRDKMEIVDAREEYRYRGESEPIDKIAGRIPGSINVPYMNLVDGPYFKDVDEIKKSFREIDKTPVLYCGSGVTSCINYFALDMLGMHPLLYAGSYSDWISYEENPVERD